MAETICRLTGFTCNEARKYYCGEQNTHDLVHITERHFNIPVLVDFLKKNDVNRPCLLAFTAAMSAWRDIRDKYGVQPSYPVAEGMSISFVVPDPKKSLPAEEALIKKYEINSGTIYENGFAVQPD